MTRDEIIVEISKSTELKKLCKKVSKSNDLHKDIFQHLILSLLEKDSSFIVDKYNEGKLYQYCAGMIYKSWNSTTSPFAHLYRHFESNDETKIKEETYIKKDQSEPIEYRVGSMDNLSSSGTTFHWSADSDYDLNIDIKAAEVERVLVEFEKEHEDNFVHVAAFKGVLAYGSSRKYGKEVGISYRTIASWNQYMKQVLRERIKK